MRNLDFSSNRAAKTRELSIYVPFIERKSCKRMASRLTSTAQCKRDISGSSISMSAPPSQSAYRHEWPGQFAFHPLR